MKVAVIFHRFGPYHCARLGAASRRFTVFGIEIAAETRECHWSPIRGSMGYSRLTLFFSGDSRTFPGSRVSERVGKALANCSPDAVAIPGWSDTAAIAALRWCAKTGTPAILMSESTAIDKRRTRWLEWIKRRIVGLCQAALVGGQRHVDYLVSLGMPRERIFTGYDVVDNAYFVRRAEEVRSQKKELRSHYGLPKNYFLASARFIAKKNLPMLVRAYAGYRKLAHDRPWDLVLLGDGPLRQTLNAQLSALNLHPYVRLPGFKQYDELPVYYALADAFVHASTTEQWGLVVNEAIASGLPVVVSNRCGCIPELVRDNGFPFDPTNEQELALRLFKLASLSDLERARLGEASRRIAANFGLERFGEGLEEAVLLALSCRRKAALIDRLVINALARV